jgi:diguanylate cyclase
MGEFIHTVQELIANFAIVTAYLFICSQVIFKNNNFHTSVTVLYKLKVGCLAGLLGIVLMLFTVSISDTILDFRHLAIIIAALYGGIYSSVIAGLMISLMRLLDFGAISTPSLIAAVNIFVVSTIVGFICSKRFSYWKKWFYSLLAGNVLTTIAFFLNLGVTGFTPALIYFIMMSVGGVFTAYLTQFLIKVKTHFQRVEQEASIDFLTGLNNHRTFDTVFNAMMQNALDKKEYLSLMLVDIDFFKKVNDTYGHLNGDTVLKQVGELLKNTSRSFDIISRNGGEEFSILLCDCPHNHALILAERLRLVVRDHKFILLDGTSIQMTISIGVSSLSVDKEAYMIEQADLALYKAKANGRNQVRSNVS